jgi:hypothetical protein
VAAVVLLADRLDRKTGGGGHQGPWARAFAAAWAVSFLGMTALQHTEWFYPWIARLRLVPGPSPARPAPWRWADPTGRLRGHRELVPEVDRLEARLRAEGRDPFVLAPTYALASTLTFYRPGRSETYCLSWSPGMVGSVLNQHDLWHPNPRHDLDAFRGRSAVVVEEVGGPLSYARGLVELGLFARAEPAGRVVVRRGEVVIAIWNITACHDYRGPQGTEAMARFFREFAGDAYYNAQGGTADGYILGLYRDLLGRSPCDGERSIWAHILATQSRELMVAKIVASPEFRARPGR